MIVSFVQAKRLKKGEKVVPQGAMGEQFEKNPTVRARKRLNRRQGICLKLKELNVVIYDHAYLELYKSEKEGKPDLGTRKIVSQVKGLLCGLLWEKKVSHKTASMKVCWHLNWWVHSQHLQNGKRI